MRVLPQAAVSVLDLLVLGNQHDPARFHDMVPYLCQLLDMLGSIHAALEDNVQDDGGDDSAVMLVSAIPAHAVPQPCVCMYV